MVAAEIQPIEKGGERRLEGLLNKNPHSLHAQASCDFKAVSRSFPYGFHLPLPQYNIDMVSVRDLRKRRKETPSANKLSLQPSANRPQPTTRVSTHLSRLKLIRGGRNASFGPPSTMGWWVIISKAKPKVFTDHAVA